MCTCVYGVQYVCVCGCRSICPYPCHCVSLACVHLFIYLFVCVFVCVHTCQCVLLYVYMHACCIIKMFHNYIIEVFCFIVELSFELQDHRCFHVDIVHREEEDVKEMIPCPVVMIDKIM